MAIPAGVVRVVLHGNLPGGEIWETGFWMDNTGVTDASLADALANIIAGTLNANDESGALAQMALEFWSAGMNWTEVRVYGYPNGGPKAAFVGLFTNPTPVAGSGTNQFPNQVALVLTLNTGLAGRSYRGRMYIPIGKGALDGMAELTPQLLSDFVTTWRTFFSDVNVSDTGRFVVVSAERGIATPLSAVKADSRLDIQRRRANQQAIRQTVSQPVSPHPA
uniref:Uncharacterized protein n=1 Tax=uncultured prokaryote TaxID=198431 RepID=A0A0H5QM14_9ZZZZ|nr:hypothetical protein [uncultured prokaryote]